MSMRHPLEPDLRQPVGARGPGTGASGGDGTIGDGIHRLLERVQAGHADEEDRLLELITVVVQRRMLRLVEGDAATADDLTQEAMIRIIPRLGSCHARTPASTVRWIRTIAQHVFCDWVRAETRLRSALRELRSAEVVDGPQRIADPLDRMETPEENREREEKPLGPLGIPPAVLREVMEQLPVEDQRLLELSATRAHDWVAVGIVLGCSRDSARKRHSRITKRIMAQIDRRLRELSGREESRG